ncbi:hypothetical protein ACLB2K_067978 [Fragaria x ananassa]
MGSSGVCWEVLCVGGVDLIFWLTRENPPPSPPSLAPPLSAATSTHLAASHYSQGYIGHIMSMLQGGSEVHVRTGLKVLTSLHSPPYGAGEGAPPPQQTPATSLTTFPHWRVR